MTTELTLANLDAIEAAAGDGADKNPTVSGVAYTGGVMSVEYWGPVAVELSGLTIPDTVPLLADHQNLVGSKLGYIRAAVDGGNLTIDGEITSRSAGAQGIVAQYQRGDTWQLSVGVSPIRAAQYVDEGETAIVNGKETPGPFVHIVRGELAEVSVKALGADAKTRMKIAASFALDPRGESDAMFLARLKRLGVHVAAAAPGVPKPKEVPMDPEKKTEPVVDVTVVAGKAAQDALKAERERVAGIQAAFAGEFPDLERKAITDGITAAAAAEVALKATREARAKDVPNIHVGKGNLPAVQALEAGACFAVGIPEKTLEAGYKPEVLDAGRKLRGMGLREMAKLCAAHAGVELPYGVDAQWIRSAFSTTALSGILGNVANKALAGQFAAVRQVAPRITKAVNHTNFHSHTVYSMAVNGDLEVVSPRGDLKYVDFAQESYTRQLATRGAVARLSRQDIINDELGAFTDMFSRLGRKAALSREKAVGAALNATGAGVTFFTTANGNYISGATTALDSSALGTALKAFRDQTGPDTDGGQDGAAAASDPIDIEPRLLLVPPALEITALELLRSTEVRSASGTKTPTRNIWAGMFEPVVFSRIGAAVSGGSNTNWYLLADPAEGVAAVEISYLNGNQQPTVEYFGLDQDVDTLGVSWRIYWDFGVDRAEHRAGVKSKGAA